MTPLTLVGELNPYGADPHFALYDLPEQASGHRLRTIMGVSSAAYRQFARVNLCTGKWSAVAARGLTWDIEVEHPTGVLVLLGRKVAGVFLSLRRVGTTTPPPFTLVHDGPGSFRYLVLPHPSGLCREWREPGAVERARSLLRTAAPDVAWGEIDAASQEPGS